MNSTVKFRRYAPGLYVDSTNTYVISRDVEATGSYRAFYTVRRLLGFGPCLDGVTMMPDYDHVHLGQAHSLNEAKQHVADILTANNEAPIS